MLKTHIKKGHILAILTKKGHIIDRKRAIFFLRNSLYISKLREVDTRKKAIFNGEKRPYYHVFRVAILRKTLIFT